MKCVPEHHQFVMRFVCRCGPSMLEEPQKSLLAWSHKSYDLVDYLNDYFLSHCLPSVSWNDTITRLALYPLNSSILLESHKYIAPGLYLQSYIRERAIKYNNIAYSNDTDGHVSANHDSKTPMESVIEDMRKSAKILNNLIMILGGSLALHKTSWRILAWEMVRGELKLVKATNERIMMEEGRGKGATRLLISSHQMRQIKGWDTAYFPTGTRIMHMK